MNPFAFILLFISNNTLVDHIVTIGLVGIALFLVYWIVGLFGTPEAAQRILGIACAVTLVIVALKVFDLI